MIHKALAFSRNKLSSPDVISGIWVLGGFGFSQILRFSGNLVLTRLLYPEAFGLMAIVSAVMVGVGLLSDVGIRGALINSERTTDPDFLKTAWTLQFIRGFFLCAFTIAIAFPLAEFYESAELAPLLILVAVGSIVDGARSIAMTVNEKNMNLKSIVRIDMLTQAASMLVMIVGSLIYPTVWFLAIGGLVGVCLRCLSSYLFFTGHHSQFCWDKSTVSEIVRFGRWVMLSSALAFLLMHADKFVLGYWLSIRDLGIYSVAVAISGMVVVLANMLANKYLFPLFKKKMTSQNEGLGKIVKIRRFINIAFVSITIVVALTGDWVIQFLYDDRYKDAGWMLQLLAIGSIGVCFSSSLSSFLLANGDSFRQMKYQFFAAVTLLAAMWIGGNYGVVGMLLGISFAPIVSYPLITVYSSRYGYRCLYSDFALLCTAVLIILAGWLMTGAPIIKKITGVFA